MLKLGDVLGKKKNAPAAPARERKKKKAPAAPARERNKRTKRAPSRAAARAPAPAARADADGPAPAARADADGPAPAAHADADGPAPAARADADAARAPASLSLCTEGSAASLPSPNSSVDFGALFQMVLGVTQQNGELAREAMRSSERMGKLCAEVCAFTGTAMREVLQNGQVTREFMQAQQAQQAKAWQALPARALAAIGNGDGAAAEGAALSDFVRRDATARCAVLALLGAFDTRFGVAAGFPAIAAPNSDRPLPVLVVHIPLLLALLKLMFGIGARAADLRRDVVVRALNFMQSAGAAFYEGVAEAPSSDLVERAAAWLPLGARTSPRDFVLLPIALLAAARDEIREADMERVAFDVRELARPESQPARQQLAREGGTRFSFARRGAAAGAARRNAAGRLCIGACARHAALAAVAQAVALARGRGAASAPAHIRGDLLGAEEHEDVEDEDEAEGDDEAEEDPRVACFFDEASRGRAAAGAAAAPVAPAPPPPLRLDKPLFATAGDDADADERDPVDSLFDAL